MGLTAQARVRIFGDPAKPGAFGLGTVLLLEGVEEECSLNRAAKRLGMAYSKAWRVVNEGEEQLGVKLLERNGAKGSALTPEGRRAVEAYRALMAEVDELVAARLPELLG